MALSRLIVEHFRNLQSFDVNMHHGFNFIVGKNGSGKSSLLEAIYYLGHGRSFKSALASRVIQYEQPHFTLFAQLTEQNKQWSIGLQKTRQGQSAVKINGEEGNKIADLAHLLPIQLISPEEITLLNGGPSYRRAFIDWGLFHHQPEFYQTWTRLRRLLKQRNAALSQVQHYNELAVWDHELAVLANKISQWRESYVTALYDHIVRSCALFLPELDISQRFYQGWEKESDYSELLKRNFERDRQLGYTFSGPQKADLKLKANGIPLDDVLSRGQLKLMMCALRLAQGEYLIQNSVKTCLFLLDDFSSELDPNKQELLAQRLQQIQAQVFISTIQLEQLNPFLCETHALFQLQQGKLQREK